MKYLLVLLTSSLSTAKVTFQSQLAKKESRSVADNIFFNTLIFFAASLLFLPYLFSASLKIWAYAAVYAFCNVLFQIVYSVALSRGNVSVAVMFANFGMLVPVAFSVALFGDTPSVFRIVGICLIMVALVFTLKKGGISQKGYRWLVLFCMLANGCGLTVQKLFALSGEGGSIFSFVSAGYLLSALMCAVSYGGAVVITNPQKKMRLHGRLFVFAIAAGVSLGAFLALNTYAGKTVDGSFHYPAHSGCAILLSSLAGTVIFREKLSRQQCIACIIGGVAIVLMNF